jgi:mono/diheme cytochrome c family protein
MTLFFALGAGASLLVGAYAIFGLVRQHLFINGATALLLVALAFTATAGGEFVREGVRKPYTIRQLLYSNSITEEEVVRLRERGCTTDDPYPLQNAGEMPTPQLAKGARVYRTLCSVCHTVDGANGLVHLTGTWSVEQLRLNIAKLQRTKPFMPPFAGNAEEVEALVQWLRWNAEERPGEWSDSTDPAVIAQIDQWLDEAGTQPGVALAARDASGGN